MKKSNAGMLRVKKSVSIFIAVSTAVILVYGCITTKSTLTNEQFSNIYTQTKVDYAYFEQLLKSSSNVKIVDTEFSVRTKDIWLIHIVFDYSPNKLNIEQFISERGYRYSKTTGMEKSDVTKWYCKNGGELGFSDVSSINPHPNRAALYFKYSLKCL